ncbi:hypothetical protein Syun_009107 [Stephania yunnanensis]|uniref:Glucosidase II beta subunit N-terminal domain-containing protein n=1 Tax=Stephania yunnanensis TaxID=152371 RepID=A0AAP0KFK0_9MAGN
MKPNLSFAVSLLFCSNLILGSASSPRGFLGIPPQDLEYFKSDVIKCRDGSNKFTKAQLNDDFCDCADGTDEPGTSACPVGKFYCQNAGHVPLLIFSSRVNDGICDCCDGSDEYDSGVNCPNTCWEAGKVAREKLKKKIATYQEGVSKRKQEIEQAKLAITKDEAELSKLKKEEEILKEIVEQLRDRKEQIEKAEEKERLEKEKEEKKKKESEEKINEEQSSQQKVLLMIIMRQLGSWMNIPMNRKLQKVKMNLLLLILMISLSMPQMTMVLPKLKLISVMTQKGVHLLSMKENRIKMSTLRDYQKRS